MRHGERTPLLKETYPTDPYNVSTYGPLGFAQLTNRGKLTEYRIGTMLRQRYNDFLGSIYHPQDIYAISSDSDRTKMSLQLMLAGLYPPDVPQLWNPDLPWLPIPTYYAPKKVDMLFKAKRCPIYKAAFAETKKMKEVRDKIAVHENLFKFLMEKTGLAIEKLPLNLYNLLTAQKNMNLTLPEWCTDDVYRQMQEAVVLDYEIRSYTTQLKRLNGGMFIKKFIDNINKRSRKMYVYSGHEVNIAAFGRAQNISEPKLPDYGSAFLLEKLRDDSGKLYIKIFLWTGTTEKLMPIKLAGCNEVCPLETYLELVRDVIPSDNETTCLWDNITKEELLELFAEKLNLN
ncbi:PREDICTED: venom acid phosphatase Acph-1-like isoform X2 [Vollenhovia emeryi]|nr:PREDICTED: venom acid phosphatase Acph-1-like isoform X2 [Vollenhovia emeryi]XP_011864388.1 PREDICTED: venom acid phosphatase Acph-1-like isoform X2 [Vollenhovia emeryi]XP_011864389.1 PREDICTED: venom acid phosphatase Acph-1-like isoform X2 [Vollenhovia emeryi]XP_011864390.1 PREDICTED: venom acid phosphatase Acph-1-like isoform X2 [Vollenhovia emeryi]